MLFFIFFLSYVAGLILINENTYFIAIFLLIFCLIIYFLKYKKNRKIAIVSIIFLALGLIRDNIDLKSLQNESYIGVVIDSTDNYFVFFDGLEKFYVPCSDNVRLFSLIKIEGTRFNFSFATLESGFDFNKYLHNKGINVGIYIKNIENIINFPFDFEAYKLKILEKFSSNDAKAFASSLIFNDSISSSSLIIKVKNIHIMNLFSITGVFLNFLLYGIARLLNFKLKDSISKFVSLFICFPFLFFTINRFTTIRVIVFYLFSTLNNYVFQEKISRLNFLSISGLLFLIINKDLINQLSFYIPYLLYFLLYFSWLLLNHYKKGFEQKIAQSIITFFVLLPFIINMYKSFNFLNIILNIVLLPIFKFIFIVLVISFYGIYFNFFTNILNFAGKILRYINIDLININVPSFNQYSLILYFILLMACIYFHEINYRKKSIKYISLLTSSLIIYCLPIENTFTTEICFINVGQGDSTLIRCGLTTILIDTGGLTYTDVATNNLIPYLKSKRIYSVDAVLITHKDFDHYGALDSLKRNFKVKNVYDYNSIFPLTVGSITFDNLNIYKDQAKEENDKSLVLYSEIKNNKFLFMGDAPKSIEKRILDDQKNLDCDYLKVGHHGSNTSSSEEFINQISPNEAIISCGLKNKFHHPNIETINLLNKYKINIRRTDQEGTISYKFI